MKNLDYDDISLIPRVVSSIVSREEIKLDEELFPGLRLTVPIISSPMIDVTSGYIAKKMRELGGVGVLHRFCSIEEQLEALKYTGPEVICAVGLDDWERLARLFVGGCKYFCLDVANGANDRIADFMEKVKIHYKDFTCWMVGNVASADIFGWCAELPNVYAVRCGIGGGAGCTTTQATGICHKPIAMLHDFYAYDVLDKSKIIMDGGIKTPGDFCKAMAFGANFIMLGSVIAKAWDSPAVKRSKNEVWVTEYRGSSSEEIQEIYKDKVNYVEGKKVILESNTDSLETIIRDFMNGLRSSMSYFDCRTLEEYTMKPDWIENK